MSDTPQAQPVVGQDQQGTQTADPTPASSAQPQAAPAAQTLAPGPWSNDLETLFPDEATRGAVDSFLRSKVQPYTTQLEQKASVSENAQRLWNDLEQSPIDTYVAITNEMFGEDAAKSLLATIQQEMASQPPSEQPAAQQTATQQPTADPRMEAMFQWFENQQATEAYDAGLARISSDPNTQDVDTDLLHPFVAAAGGNFDEAVTMYRNFYTQFTAKNGAPPPPQEEPPAVMGSDTTSSTPSAIPQEPRKQSLDEAINDFMAENRAAREAPPVIG